MTQNLAVKRGALPDRPDIACLRVLATTDLHVHITPWDYYGDRTSSTFGLARTASLIAAARAEVGCSLLLDNGDFLQGSPMGDVEALGRGRNGPHPMIAAMNALHYDAVTLGNHEFSHGIDFLLRSLADAKFPVISANIARQLGATPLDDQTLVPPTVILTRTLPDSDGNSQTLRIGIIGFAPPQVTRWDRLQLAGSIQTRDILQAAAAHVPKLRAEGADIVIALSHSGIGSSIASADMENASAALAALPGIDAVIAGHTHQTFPSDDFLNDDGPAYAIDPVLGRLYGKPAVMPGFHGSHLGIIDLFLSFRAGRWRLVDSHAELRPIARRSRSGAPTVLAVPDPAILAVVDRAHQATRNWSLQPIGFNPKPLHTHFAMVASCSAVRLVAQAQAVHVTRALQNGPYADWPVVSAAAPFHCGGRAGPENYTFIDADALVMRNAFDLYPHPNLIAALDVTGAELSQWLERSFSQFNQIKAGAQDAALVHPDFPSFNFDTIDPLTWQVDLTQPPRFNSRGTVINPNTSRITALAYRGEPIDPARHFVLATNSYRASGSNGFAGASPDRVILSGPESNRDILLAYIAEHHGVPPLGPANWHFTAMPGTTALFESAPDAEARVGHFAMRRVEALEVAANGFRRFRLHL
ncbi:MAG: bifunctional 2',3'-cyclic-nucleotide 2'-phosphodiesterase/3'-nucleotidase [Paracoccaceae bacterium]